jgi:hypothetical protein
MNLCTFFIFPAVVWDGGRQGSGWSRAGVGLESGWSGIGRGFFLCRMIFPLPLVANTTFAQGVKIPLVSNSIYEKFIELLWPIFQLMAPAPCSQLVFVAKGGSGEVGYGLTTCFCGHFKIEIETN